MRRNVMLLAAVAFSVSIATAQTESQSSFQPAQGTPLPTGMYITPTAAPGSSVIQLNPGLSSLPTYIAGQPQTTLLSPDGKTLLALTSGYNDYNDSNGNAIPQDSNEYVFVFDVSKDTLVQKQVIEVPNTFFGIAWNPNGKTFYVTGGVDDNIHVYNLTNGSYVEGTAIALGHQSSPLLQELLLQPAAAGIAVNAAGTQAIVANLNNHSVTLVDLQAGTVLAEQDLRPGVINPAQDGVPGGEYPFWVVWAGNQVYVSSMRDRQIVVLNLSTGSIQVADRISVDGEPSKMIPAIASNGRAILLATLDNEDYVDVIDMVTNQVVDQIATLAPPNAFSYLVQNGNLLKGANPNSLALSPGGRTLYVTNGGTNSIAVIALNTFSSPSFVKGLIPTGWYPSSVTVSRDGSTLFNTFTKNLPGPNIEYCSGCYQINEYVLQLQKGGMATIPVPNAATLNNLTQQVAANDHFSPGPDMQQNEAILAQVRSKIKHVIYIIKENRTYDQVLGDLPEGNGDPALAMFGAPYTPNLHALASNFVDLDSFYDTGEVSGVGWNWSNTGRTIDYTEKTINLNYAYPDRFSNYDYEGTNQNLNVGYPTLAERIIADPLTPNDPNILPGAINVNTADSSDGILNGEPIWDLAQRAGLTVRSYGFFIDLARYSLPASLGGLPPSTTPYASNMIQAFTADPGLIPVTDQYYRGFDNNWPDYYREQEWEREFDQYVTGNNLPSLELIRLMHDHTGDFGSAQFGVNTPEAQVADNDYSVALLLNKVANSPYANDTLVFIVEDDAQDGPDHVDAHRSIAFVVGPYVKKGAVISAKYSTVNLLRTMKDVLGIPYYALYDGTQSPMSEVFDLSQTTWSYSPIVPQILCTTTLPVTCPASVKSASSSQPRHDAEYWESAMAGQNFEEEDKLDTAAYNLALWKGLMGDDVPYPTIRDGRNLSQNRSVLLKEFAARQAALRSARHDAVAASAPARARDEDSE